MKNKCKGITKKGVSCKNTALEGKDLCRIHYPDKKGKALQKIGGTAGKMAFGALIKEGLGKIYEWLKDNADIFFSSDQNIHFLAIQEISPKEQEEKLIEFILNLPKEKIIEVLSEVGIKSHLSNTSKKTKSNE